MIQILIGTESETEKALRRMRAQEKKHGRAVQHVAMLEEGIQVTLVRVVAEESMENCEKRSMKACAACAEIFTCEKSPYRAEAGQVLEEDWRGYNRIRAMMCSMPAERYVALRELAMTDEKKQIMEESEWSKIPEDVRKHFDHLLIEEGIIGLERVHRMLLKMVEDGTVRVIPSKKTEQKCSQCSDGTQASHDIHCSHLQKRAVPDRFSHSDNMSAGSRNDGQGTQDNQP